MIYTFSSAIGWTNKVMHTHDSHEFLFCLAPQKEPDAPAAEAACWHFIEEAKIPTFQGDLFLIPAGQRHLAQSCGEYLCPCIVLNCTDEDLSELLPGDADAVAVLRALVDYAVPGRNCLPLTREDNNRIHELLLGLEDERARKRPGWRCAQKQLFMSLLLAIFRTWSGSEPLRANIERAEPSERIRDVVRFIEAQYMTPIEVEDMLRISCLSRSHFHAVFKKETGNTFKDHLNRVRVRHAKKMLQETDMSIAQIALSCGFSSQSRFNHVFRQIAGCTPGIERRVQYSAI